jgi:hypothetical protein
MSQNVMLALALFLSQLLKKSEPKELMNDIPVDNVKYRNTEILLSLNIRHLTDIPPAWKYRA